MRRTRFVFAIALVLVSSLQAVAQTYTRGREAAKGTVNFAELAEYQLKHPERYKQKPVMAEAESEAEEGTEPEATDPALVRSRPPRIFGKTTAGPLMPVSSSPADTFLAYTSTGTSIPPDTHGNVDSTYCVTANNAVIRVQTRVGGVVSTVSSDAFWGSTLLGGTGMSSFDPRVHYDPYAKRWILVDVSTNNPSFSGSRILIAVTATGNPTGTWYKFAINVYSTTAPAGWLDFPNVGFNGKWICVTGNYFSAAGSSTGSAIWCFNKAALYANTGSPNVKIASATLGFTIAPAQTYDPLATSLFVINMDDGTPGGGAPGRLRLRKITGAVGSPVLSGTIGNPAAGSLPSSVRRWQSGVSGDFAPQLGVTNKVQNNDNRITNCVFRNGKVWCAHTVFYPSTGTPTRSSVMWWQIDTAAVPQQVGLIDDPTGAKFYAFPSIAVNALDDALVGFSTFSSSIYPSAAYSIHYHTDPDDSMRTPYIYRYGKKPYYRTFGGTQNRWGDYSATCVDPRNDNDFWTIQEAVPNYSGAISASLWDTWWARVQICPTPPSPALTSSPAVHCVGTSLSYTIGTVPGATSYTWAITPTTGGWAMTTSTTETNSIAAGTGVATVTVTANNSCGPGSPLTFTITGAAAPPAPTITVVTPACVGAATASFTASASGATAYSWSATGPGWGGTSATAAFSPSIGSSAGSVSVFASNTCGSSPVTTLAVPLDDVPAAATDLIAPTLVCSGATITLSTTPPAGATSYTWAVSGAGWAGGGTTTVPSKAVTAGTGSGFLTVTPVNACGSGPSFSIPALMPVGTPSASYTLTAHTTLLPASVTVTYTGTISSSATYAWSFGGGTATPGTGVGPHTVTWPTVGTKTIALSVTDSGCTSTTFTDTVRVRTNVALQHITKPQFLANIVPNPNDGSFEILFDRAISNAVTVTIYDMQGREVYSRSFDAVNGNKIAITTSSLPAGNYMATIYSDGAVANKKITIER
ncbi:MAG: T9SS type A sorting domain-containing protein [Bacteroidota bacterium]